jgi:Flp pilus assembly protein TadG
MLRADCRCKRPRRRGAVVVLAAVIMSVMVGMLAFAVDIGYIELSRTQLQAAADSSALAGAASVNLSRADMETVAKRFADANMVAGRKVQLQSRDIEYGTWDAGARTFTPSPTPSNAVRVTVRTDDDTGGKTKLFFARIFNVDSLRQQASAVATVNPRDICFVVDLSGSMNDDTQPDNTAGINSNFASHGYPTIGSDLLNQVYADFGFNCTYPNEPSQWIGKPLGVSSSGNPLTTMTANGGVLTKSSIPAQYRIKNNDSTAVRKQKAYSWAMDVQMPQVIAAAKPKPNSTTNYAYWANYLDSNYTQIGYRTYVQFMMYNGRDLRPDGVNYTPLSQFSPNCPWHSESTDGGVFSFPPREQPTHAARRAIIAAIDLIKDRNDNISDMEQRDWVSIVTFDSLSSGGPKVLVPLTGDYDTAMATCPRLQACSDNGASTATETGLMMAYNHIKPESKGGHGREATNKIVVLLTDGMPNLYSSSSNTIHNYIGSNPSSNFYGNKNPQDAALMQTSIMQGDRWSLYPVGIGLGCDYNFMDRMGRMGATANKDGQSPRGSGNPADYEQRLKEIFENIITNPKLRLVQ